MLEKLNNARRPKGPVVTIIMDGIGIRDESAGNALKLANTPVLDRLLQECPHTLLHAHGTSVGMPNQSDMGNSEVGHNALGSGQVFSQGAALVNNAINSGDLFAGETWQELISNIGENSTLHLLGLFSDGNVHSHIDHLEALIERACAARVQRIRVHVLLDGRDVAETSALDYLQRFELFLSQLPAECDVRIGSGGGRQTITMDRYEANWSLVEKGWQVHVLGEGRQFASAREAIETLREENPGVIDQDLPSFVIAEANNPIGTINDGDSVVLFNFRGDRAVEISQAFDNPDFAAFDRKRVPKVKFAGMLQYDGDLQIPQHYLVEPPVISHTMGEYLAGAGEKQLAVSETQKYGHVTYFWNGNRSSKFDENLEEYIEVPSDVVPFEQRPWMKAAEVTDILIEKLRSGEFTTARVNYANGDMVGHTGNLAATIIAVETVDLALARLLPVIEELGGVALITADHGNAEEMFETKNGELVLNEKGQPKNKTSHTLNPVPFIIYGGENLQIRKAENLGLANVAATTMNLLGYRRPAMWLPGILELGDEQ